MLTVGAGVLALVLTAGLGAWMVARDGEGAEGAASDADRSPPLEEAARCDLPGDLAPEYVAAARDEPTVPGTDFYGTSGHTFPRITFLQDGELIAVSHPEGIALWDTETGDEVAYVGADLPDFAGIPVLSPDGCRFGYPDSEAGVHLFDLRTGEQSRHMDDLRLPDGLLEFSPDSRFLAAAQGSAGSGAYVIDLADWTSRTVYESNAEGLAYSPSGRFLAVSGMERTVVVDTETYDEVFQDVGASAPGLRATLAFSEDDLLYYRNLGNVIPVDPVSGEEGAHLHPPEGALRGFETIAAHPGTGLLHAIVELPDEEDGVHRPELTVWDTATGEPAPAEETSWYARDFALHPDGSVLAVLNGDAREAALVDAATLEVLTVIAVPFGGSPSTPASPTPESTP